MVNDRNQKWKDRAFRSGLSAVILGGAFLLVNDFQVARENNRNINPDIFPAFRKLEGRVIDRYDALSEAFKDPNLWMTKRELWLYHEEGRCAEYPTRNGWESACTAESYYNSIAAHDFALPPFYKPGYKPKTPYWKFWK